MTATTRKQIETMASPKRFRWLRFYWMWIRAAAPPSLNLADWLAAAVGVLAPLLIWFVRARTSNLDAELETLLADLQWMIPAVAVGGIIVFRMLAAPYHLFRSMEDERDRLVVEDDEVTIKLAEFHLLGGLLHSQDIGEDGFPEWQKTVKKWEGLVHSYVKDHLGTVDAHLFNLRYSAGTDWKRAVSAEHRAALNVLWASLQSLREMIERRR